jgi:DNA-binding NarL/FixJ family response regulator
VTMAKNIHLLIVEDEPLVTDVLRETLEVEYCVSCAKTVAEAFALLRTSHIDIALVDSVLPDGRGGDVAEFAENQVSRLLRCRDIRRRSPGLSIATHRICKSHLEWRRYYPQ